MAQALKTIFLPSCLLFIIMKVKAFIAQILYDLMDCRPPGSSVHGILQARILEGVVIPSAGDLPNPDI